MAMVDQPFPEGFELESAKALRDQVRTMRAMASPALLIAKQFSRYHAEYIQNRTAAISAMGRAAQNRWAMQEQMATISTVGTAAQAMLDRQSRAFAPIARAVEAQRRAFAPLAHLPMRLATQHVQAAIREMTIKIYQPLLDMTKAVESLKTSLPTTALQGPVLATPRIELYLATRQAEIYIGGSDPSDEECEFIEQVRPDRESFYDLLGLAGTDLIQAYEGAVEASTSTNVDRARHTMSSLRELVTHVLHRLAPDEAFFGWDSHKAYLDDRGRPSRPGRLRYICRYVNHGEWTAFIEKDVQAAVAFLDLLNKLHKAKPQQSDLQLRALLIRAEGLITVLIKTAYPEHGEGNA